jgi:cytochrome c oxidase cbb3-type subunit 2
MAQPEKVRLFQHFPPSLLYIFSSLFYFLALENHGRMRVAFRTEKETMNMLKPNPLTLASLALFLGAAIPSLAADGASKGAAPAFLPASASRGQVVYQKACAGCHGENGDAKVPTAKPLNPKPRDFTTGLYKFHSTPFGDLPTDNDLFVSVSAGVPGTQMFAMQDILTEQERLDVVAYIKGFSEDFKKPPVVDTLEVPDPPASSPELVAEGKKVFMVTQCWTCHGVKGKGDGTSANVLKDSWGYPIKPRDLAMPPYKRGSDPKSLYKTIVTGLNGTPMSGYTDAFLFGGDMALDSAFKASFSREEIGALQAYMKSQPVQADVEAMPAERKNELALHRKWALVHYVRSLIRKPGVLNWLFMEDMEVTR